MRWGLLSSARHFAADDGGAGGGETPASQETPAPIENAGQDGSGKSDVPASENAGGGTDPPAGETPAPEPKPRRADRHVANLTARLAAERAATEAAERRAEAAEALLRAKEPETPETPRRAETVDRATVRAEIEFDTKRQSLIENGASEFPDWDDKTSILHGLGATQNPAFMQALVELPNAAKIVAALADDTDTLVGMLGKSAVQIAAQLGRMDAKMDTPTKPAMSNAPRPVPKVEAPVVMKEPDIYDDSLSMKEWAAVWDKRQKAMGKRR